MRTLGERIKELRNNKNLTQDEMATYLNVNRSTLANWETNRADPDPDTLKLLADYFQVTVDYLLGRTSFIQGDKHPYFYFGGKKVDIVDIKTVDGQELTKKEREEIVKFAEYVLYTRRIKQEKPPKS